MMLMESLMAYLKHLNTTRLQNLLWKFIININLCTSCFIGEIFDNNTSIYHELAYFYKLLNCVDFIEILNGAIRDICGRPVIMLAEI